MARPAVPAKVHLRMRFLKADGNPLADTSYRVRWGSDKAPPTPVAVTSPDGWVDEVLSGSFTRGVVELGEHDPADPAAKTFVPRLFVNVVLVKPPGPPPKHHRPNQKNDDPPPDAPQQSSPPKGGGSGEPPPPDPGAAPPGPGTPQMAPPGLISMPDGPPADFKPEGRGHPKKPEPAAESPVVVERRLEKLDRFSGSLHDKRVRVFHLAWRLHNLGYLSLQSEYLVFPIDGGKHADILDALNRYAYKHGFTLLSEGDLSSADDTLSEIWDHIDQTHDTP